MTFKQSFSPTIRNSVLLVTDERMLGIRGHKLPSSPPALGNIPSSMSRS